jgi:DNA-binding SARP family transcriptional activator
MIRIVTGNLANSQDHLQTPSADPPVREMSEIMQLVHVASFLLRQGEVALAQQVLDDACALTPLPLPRTPGSAAKGCLYLLNSKPADAAHSPSDVVPTAQNAPVRIRALGGFEIAIDGIVFASGIKPQRRPLDLLKLLVLSNAEAIGAGELADKLWPDSDGDTARNCLQVAVHRLRRLLGYEQAVLVYDRKLRLDRRLCWVDLWEFEAEAASLADTPITGADFAARATRALQLYRGHLFSHETDQAWMLAPRERVRRTWLDLVRGMGRHHETRGDWEAGCALYQSAIELDPIAEELYRRLMMCQDTSGQRSEALCTYRRCRKQLSAVLSAEPAPETERLYRALCSAAS